MFDASSAVRTDVREMDPYEPILPFDVILSEQLGLARSEIVKLDANENPYGPPASVREALAALEDIHIYPDPESRHLRRALARAHDLPLELLIAGAGADELIDLTMRLLLEPGDDAILTCPPTFGMYEFDGALNGARVISIPRREDFSLDLAAVEEAITRDRPKLLLLAHPNNPDGKLARDEALERLLQLPVTVLLDEAYIEFAEGNASWLPQVPNRTNLIVLRTFSKWAGLAGLRVGYGGFPKALIPHLWKIKQPYNVSVSASAAALAALADRDELATTAARLRGERKRMAGMLTEVPYLKPYPSQANFVLCKVVGRNAETVRANLRGEGILVRHFDKPGLRDHIRISVGRPRDTDRLIRALRAME